MLLAGLQFNVSWFAQNKVCCQLCMDRVFPSWFGAGAVLEGIERVFLHGPIMEGADGPLLIL
jgi:hypothetical protein